MIRITNPAKAVANATGVGHNFEFMALIEDWIKDEVKALPVQWGWKQLEGEDYFEFLFQISHHLIVVGKWERLFFNFFFLFNSHKKKGHQSVIVSTSIINNIYTTFEPHQVKLNKDIRGGRKVGHGQCVGQG